MDLNKFQSLPEFLTSDDLVKLGLYLSTNSLYFARLRGKSPDFVKIGRRVIYPKESVVEFITSNIKKGSFSPAEYSPQ